MQLRSHVFSCYKLPNEFDSNCMLPQQAGLKMHVPLTAQMQLRNHVFLC